jgi:hypothetical protein
MTRMKTDGTEHRKAGSESAARPIDAWLTWLPSLSCPQSAFIRVIRGDLRLSVAKLAATGTNLAFSANSVPMFRILGQRRGGVGKKGSRSISFSRR